MKKDLLGKTLVIGILVLFIGITIIPCLSANIIKNSENLVNSENEKSSSTIDWWPMFHHDLNNSGYSTSIYAPETNNVLWRYQTNFWVSSSPAIVNNRVYFGSDDGNFYCLNTSGALIWKDDLPWGSSVSSPYVVDGKVITGSSYDYIYCWDANTGEKIWRFYKGQGSSCSPAASKGKVYITYSQQNNKNYYGKISCLNLENGTEFWNRIFFDGTLNNVAIYDGKIFVPHSLGRLYCLDGETGQILWEKNTGGWYGAPAISNSKVYASANGIMCLDTNTGEEFWHYQGNRTICSPAVAYNKVYYVSYDTSFNGTVICLDADTGNEVWTYKTGSGNYPSPAVADGKVYVGTYGSGMLICLNASNGDMIWDYPISVPKALFSSPAIANGRLYICGIWEITCFGDFSSPPAPPIINGPTCVKVGNSYNYTFNSVDSEDDDVYFYINWGDGNIEFWDGPHPSGLDFEIAHTYIKRGKYIIEAKAIDIYGYESNWSELEVNITRIRATFNSLFHWFLERFAILERLF